MIPDNINNIDDLITNDSFKRWLLNNDATDAAFWNQWLEEHPGKLELVATAKALILSIHHLPGLTAAEIEQEISIFRQSIAYSDQEEASVPQIRKWPHLAVWLKAAAAVLLFAGVWYAYRLIAHGTYKEADTYQKFLADHLTHGIEYANNTDSVQQFIMTDGTRVSLEPASRLSISSNYAIGNREVFLTGDAFFTVVKNSSHPFTVYAKDVVTKVLGTSFWVKQNGSTKQTSVIVKTGRVSVFKPAVSNNAASEELSGVILTPNQQIVYDAGIDKMKKTLIADPESFEPVPEGDFSFDDIPADQVLKKLEKTYGISILFDHELLATCSVSAVLEQESFYEKLRIICRIIHADYQIVDGNVIVNSKGCK
jgi:ferric-dicitrate binding protein FerR (iron transport regulator)